MEKHLLTVHETVMLTGRSEASIRHMIKCHQIPFHKFGYAILIPCQAVEQIKQRTRS
jgi:hypothetical protein